jgi:hypothetical protein
MHNKIKSFNLRGKRSPGRPFNTTTYPWRSTAIGRGFFLRSGMKPGQQMLQKLRNEGFRYRAIDLSDSRDIRFFMERLS